ncbi:hypothetical protein C806_01362 [Lachnospiraceae bacterium 3-1]|nr:hypothetical protein C806_01362 [Lachnospiraceae bacterium 3-1]
MTGTVSKLLQRKDGKGVAEKWEQSLTKNGSRHLKLFRK